LSEESEIDIICRYKIRGVHSGILWDFPATGKEVELSAMVVCKFLGERVIDQYNYFDIATLLQLRQ